MEIIPFPKKTGRPKGSTSIKHKLERIHLEAQIAQAEHDLAITRRMAIRAGLARDVISNARYTAKCQELNEKLFKLNCAIRPSMTDLFNSGI